MTKWDGIALVDCICSIFVTGLYAPVECTNSYTYDLRCGGVFLLYTVLCCGEIQQEEARGWVRLAGPTLGAATS